MTFFGLFKLATPPIVELPIEPVIPEFYITPHAMQRIKERMNVRHDKIPKMVAKVWNEKTPVSQAFINRKHYNSAKYKRNHYRLFHGMVFVFMLNRRYTKQLGVPQKALVTVHSYKTKK